MSCANGAKSKANSISILVSQISIFRVSQRVFTYRNMGYSRQLIGNMGYSRQLIGNMGSSAPLTYGMESSYTKPYSYFIIISAPALLLD